MIDPVENTPGQKAIAVRDEIDKALDFKRPFAVPRRRVKQKVLDEDSYVEALSKIIQRDFFPELEKLKAQSDYLDAVEKNDIIKLRQLYVKYSEPRRSTERIPSPATFETPANIHNSQIPAEETPTEVPAPVETVPPLTLDQFLNSHTSQDNQSFEELMIEAEIKNRRKYSYLYNEEEKSEAELKQLLALPSVEQQAALPEKKLNIDTWSYKNKNYIMYVPDGVELTKEEELELHKKRKEVIYGNTRLNSNPFNESQSKEVISELAKTSYQRLDGKIGVDGKELVVQEGGNFRGYGLLKSPSPSPGGMDTPLMTWGEIEGTPFRLDGGDTPLPRSQGPSFKMSEPPRREQIAFALAEKVGVRHRDEKKKAMDAARRNLASPSPRPHSSSTIDRLATMSPAARKLATSKLRLNCSPSNFALRSSYSPSPLNRSATLNTPRRTPTPKDLGIKKPVDQLTDDLLTINVPKRKRAADFF